MSKLNGYSSILSVFMSHTSLNTEKSIIITKDAVFCQQSVNRYSNDALNKWLQENP